MFYFSHFILFFILCYCSFPFGLFPLLFFSFFCCGFVLPCCSCFKHIFIFPNRFFIFLILFYSSYIVIVLLCFFFFFFSAMPCSLQDLGSQAECRVQAPVVGAPSPNRWTNGEPQTPGNINQSEDSRRSSSQHQDLALPNCLQTPVLDALGQTTSKTGI